ncbi:unnamed protein product, partial [Meganyctiphanes norvegica]
EKGPVNDPGGVEDSNDVSNSAFVNMSFENDEECSNENRNKMDIDSEEEFYKNKIISTHSNVAQIHENEFVREAIKKFKGKKANRRSTCKNCKMKSKNRFLTPRSKINSTVATESFMVQLNTNIALQQLAKTNHLGLYNSCNIGATEKVRLMLQERVRPDLKKSSDEKYEYPLNVACFKGYHEIVKILTDYMEYHNMTDCLKMTDTLGNTPLICTAIGSTQDTDNNINIMNKEIDHFKCMETLLKYRDSISIDAQNNSKNTALHYVVQMRKNASYSKLLISNGANFDIKNERGVTPISKISYPMMEEILDSCVMNNTVDNISNDIKLDLSIFLHSSSEMKLVEAIMKSSQLKKLLSHPLISVFRSIKWKKIKQFSFFKLCSYVIYLLFLMTYVVLFHMHILDKKEMKDSMYENLKRPLKCILASYCIYMTFREIVQFFLLRFRYYKIIEKYLNILIILLTSKFLWYESSDIAPWVVLLSTIKLYFL